MQTLPIQGKTLSSVYRSIIDINGDDQIIFNTIDGEVYRMYHEQNCCERVSIEDIDGYLDDLIDSPIIFATEESNDDTNAEESGTWTFYRIGTMNGCVVIRWYGSSNGCYS